jgi:molybdopterin converting factor small subunit
VREVLFLFEPLTSLRKDDLHMKVEIRLYASLAQYLTNEAGGTAENMIEIAEGTTVERLLNDLQVPMHAVKLIFLNGTHTKGDQILKEGDRLGVFPPVAGG